MNLRQSPESAAVIAKFMTGAGVSTEVQPEAVIKALSNGYYRLIALLQAHPA